MVSIQIWRSNISPHRFSSLSSQERIQYPLCLAFLVEQKLHSISYFIYTRFLFSGLAMQWSSIRSVAPDHRTGLGAGVLVEQFISQLNAPPLTFPNYFLFCLLQLLCVELSEKILLWASLSFRNSHISSTKFGQQSRIGSSMERRCRQSGPTTLFAENSDQGLMHLVSQRVEFGSCWIFIAQITFPHHWIQIAQVFVIYTYSSIFLLY